MASESMVTKSDDGVGRAEYTRSGQFYRPNVDILETADSLVVLADLPGVKSEDVDIHFEDGSLTIHGRVKERQDERTAFLLQEYGLGNYYRTFRVSEQIDSRGIAAELSEGVLKLTLPKAESAKPRRISVQSN